MPNLPFFRIPGLRDILSSYCRLSALVNDPKLGITAMKTPIRYVYSSFRLIAILFTIARQSLRYILSQALHPLGLGRERHIRNAFRFRKPAASLPVLAKETIEQLRPFFVRAPQDRQRGRHSVNISYGVINAVLIVLDATGSNKTAAGKERVR